ncbi:hypothetical protein AB0A77_05775 [Streptomyces varsoviensis]|uniref:hypothetical protein n=1 Tax=Streptomyces varsoviensis TaxID=67373 RepID=UPI00340B8F5C
MTATTSGSGPAAIGSVVGPSEATAPPTAAEADDQLRRSKAASRAAAAMRQLQAAMAAWDADATVPAIQVIPGTTPRILVGDSLIMLADEVSQICRAMWEVAEERAATPRC